MQFGLISITPGRDPRIIAWETPGRETGSAAKILYEVEILLHVHLLGLRRSLFPANKKQLVGNLE